MSTIVNGSDRPATFRVDLGEIFVSLELSNSTWVVTSLSPDSDKMSRRTVAGGDVDGLLACFAQLRAKAQERQGKLYPLVVIEEAGLDGFWIDRALGRESWIASYAVDAAPIAVSRRHARGLLDQICSLSYSYRLHFVKSWSFRQTRGGSLIQAPTSPELYTSANPELFRGISTIVSATSRALGI